MAEFGFFGVRVITCTQTPRRNGAFCNAGDFDLYLSLLRPLRTSWLIVGIPAFQKDLRSPGPPPLGKRSANHTTEDFACNKFLKNFCGSPANPQSPSKYPHFSGLNTPNPLRLTSLPASDTLPITHRSSCYDLTHFSSPPARLYVD